LFNLLMRSVPWTGGRDTVILGRLFEYTDYEVAASFKDDSGVLFDKLIQLPCLFMLEGTGDELAYAGTITHARIVGREISIEYTLDPDIPPLFNSTIFDKKLEFDMPHDFEFSRPRPLSPRSSFWSRPSSPLAASGQSPLHQIPPLHNQRSQTSGLGQ
jgi:hypothetical protein